MRTVIPTKKHVLTKAGARWLAGGILTIIALGQLFGFEELPRAIEGVFTAPIAAWLVAVSLVIAEVFALPYLFGLKMSPLFRQTSIALGWIALLMLFVITSSEIASNQVTSVLLGTKLSIPSGLWTVSLVIFLAGLNAYGVWGAIVKRK